MPAADEKFAWNQQGAVRNLNECPMEVRVIVFDRLNFPRWAALAWFCLMPFPALADRFCDEVTALGLDELVPVLSEARTTELLAGYGGDLSDVHRRAAAVLIAAGAMQARDISRPPASSARYAGLIRAPHPGRKGRIRDESILHAMQPEQTYTALLAATEFLGQLGALLADGVITGYDVRARGVYDHAPAERSFIYSHSSWRHLRQLITLLRSEDVNGWVSVTPKVSAFLYRDGWGGSGENVVTLADGVRVIQAREMATLFEFDDVADRQKFHALVTQYAKKDTADEPGLIADAWWQPFYYGMGDLPGFETIALIVVTAGDVEATLTVLEEKAEEVLAALAGASWTVRIDRVQVNAPFYRFLRGGYK